MFLLGNRLKVLWWLPYIITSYGKTPFFVFCFFLPNQYETAFQVAQWQRICLPMQEMWVRSLVWEDPLEEEMATHSSILAWRILWTEEPGGLQSMGS